MSYFPKATKCDGTDIVFFCLHSFFASQSSLNPWNQTTRKVVMNPRCDKNCLHEIDTQWSLSSYLYSSFGFATEGSDFRLMEDLGMKFWLEFEHPALVSAGSLFGTFWNHLTPLHNSNIFHDFVWTWHKARSHEPLHDEPLVHCRAQKQSDK